MFNGNAADALTFYAKALNGKVSYQQTYKEAEHETPEGFDDKIMHASFNAGDLVLMVSDAVPGQEVSGGNNLSLSLNFTEEKDIEKTFEALSEGATITMPTPGYFLGCKIWDVER